MKPLKIIYQFKIVITLVSMVIVFACNPSTNQTSPPAAATDSPRIAIIPPKPLPDLNVLTLDGDVFVDLPTLGPPSGPNPPNPAAVNKNLVFKYYVEGSELTMHGYIYGKKGVIPEGGTASIVKLVVDTASGVALNNMSLPALSLAWADINVLKTRLGVKPTNKVLVFIPFTKATIDADPSKFPTGINTEAGFAWVIYVADKGTFAVSHKSISNILAFATQTTATFNPSPPKELSPN